MLYGIINLLIDEYACTYSYKCIFKEKSYFIEYDTATPWERTMLIKDILKKEPWWMLAPIVSCRNLQKCNLKQKKIKNKIRSFAATVTGDL